MYYCCCAVYVYLCAWGCQKGKGREAREGAIVWAEGINEGWGERKTWSFILLPAVCWLEACWDTGLQDGIKLLWANRAPPLMRQIKKKRRVWREGEGKTDKQGQSETNVTEEEKKTWERNNERIKQEERMTDIYLKPQQHFGAWLHGSSLSHFSPPTVGKRKLWGVDWNQGTCWCLNTPL